MNKERNRQIKRVWQIDEQIDRVGDRKERERERERKRDINETQREIERERNCLLLEYCELTLYLFMFQLSVLSKIAIHQKHNHLYQIIYNNITIILKIMKNVYCM